MLQWGDKKVWKGAGPGEVSHSANLGYVGKAGERVRLGPTEAAQLANGATPLAGTTLIWTDGASHVVRVRQHPQQCCDRARHRPARNGEDVLTWRTR
jgi:hypothetical protein